MVPRRHCQTTLLVAGPSKYAAGVLAFPNVFGPTNDRTESDAERLGRLGYTVALVEVTNGEYSNPSDPRAMAAWNEWMRALPVEVTASARG